MEWILQSFFPPPHSQVVAFPASGREPFLSLTILVHNQLDQEQVENDH